MINNIFQRIRKNTIGAIMIDETFRQISSRESGQQYQQYINTRRAEIAQLKQEEFEESTRIQQSKTTNSGTSLFGANTNIFNQKVTKDIAKDLDDMEQRRKMKLDMNKMIDDMDKETFKRFQGTMITFNLSSGI